MALANMWDHNFSAALILASFARVFRWDTTFTLASKYPRIVSGTYGTNKTNGMAVLLFGSTSGGSKPFLKRLSIFEYDGHGILPSL